MSNPITPNTDENLDEAAPVEYFGIVAITKDAYVLLSDEVENHADLNHKLVAIQRYRKTARIEVTSVGFPRAAELGDDHSNKLMEPEFMDYPLSFSEYRCFADDAVNQLVNRIKNNELDTNGLMTVADEIKVFIGCMAEAYLGSVGNMQAVQNKQA